MPSQRSMYCKKQNRPDEFWHHQPKKTKEAIAIEIKIGGVGKKKNRLTTVILVLLEK